MPKGFYKDVIAVLKAHGFIYDGNRKGSHELWVHPQTNYTTTVPINLKSRHTANAIMKQASIDHKF